MAKYTPRIDHSKKDYESEAADVAQDKKIVKKAFRMHDEQEHQGEKTDLSKLKRGGRAKKEVGSVREMCSGGMSKYKAGGLIEAKPINKKPAAGAPATEGKPDNFKKGGMIESKPVNKKPTAGMAAKEGKPDFFKKGGKC